MWPLCTVFDHHPSPPPGWPTYRHSRRLATTLCQGVFNQSSHSITTSSVPARVWAQPSEPTNNTRSQKRSASHRAAKKSKAKTDLYRGFTQYSSTFTPALRQLLNSNRKATDDDQQAEIEQAINVTAKQLVQARARKKLKLTKC
jgi:hypothetical protein